MTKPPNTAAPHRNAQDALAGAIADFDNLLARLRAKRDEFFLGGDDPMARDPHWGDVGSAYRLNAILAQALSWMNGTEE